MNLLTAVKVNCRRRLTPKALKFYSVAKKLRNIGKRILQRNSALQHRLKTAEKCLRTPTFIEAEVNNVTLNFLLSQMKSQTKKPRGRRYCVNDKIFALSLFKQSPKCYRLLQKTFALPSRNSLMKLLSRVPFQVGINEPIMRSLKKCTTKMQPLDRICSLIFDEISLTPALSYNQKDDLIEGFQNTGSDRKAVFADHCMVFMLRGLHKKWKQPVAYYFVQTSMECAVLMKIIKELITRITAAGFNIVATVCDQSSINVRAMKELRNETIRNFQKEGKEFRGSGFQVNNSEIQIIYDPPHLLKCIRNNFIDSSVKFVLNNRVEVAFWKHIIQLYEMDTDDFDFKILNKLTEAHVYPEKLKKMKVSYAAQVLSQRVAANMKFLATKGM